MQPPPSEEDRVLRSFEVLSFRPENSSPRRPSAEPLEWLKEPGALRSRFFFYALEGLLRGRFPVQLELQDSPSDLCIREFDEDAGRRALEGADAPHDPASLGPDGGEFPFLAPLHAMTEGLIESYI